MLVLAQRGGYSRSQYCLVSFYRGVYSESRQARSRGRKLIVENQ